MNNKTVFKYEEKHHILEVDGVQYEIPQRTAALENLMRKRDADIDKMTEYESNMKLIEILFGKDKALQMFPNGENTNLDKLEKCAMFAVALYMADHADLQTEAICTEIAKAIKNKE